MIKLLNIIIESFVLVLKKKHHDVSDVYLSQCSEAVIGFKIDKKIERAPFCPLHQ